MEIDTLPPIHNPALFPFGSTVAVSNMATAGSKGNVQNWTRNPNLIAVKGNSWFY